MRSSIQGLGWFVRRSRDVPALSAFYRDVVGLPALRSSPTVTMFWAGESSIIEVNTGGAPNPRYTDRTQAPCVPIFRAHGIAGTIERLKAAGVTFINDIEREFNRLAYFLDPDGNVTGLQERHRTSPRPEDHEAWRRWDAGEITMAGAAPMPADLQHLGWIVLRSPDPERTIAFFRDLIGLDVAHGAGGRGAMMTLGDTVLLEIAEGGSAQPIPADRQVVSNTFILRVHDFDGIVSDLKGKGVHFVNDPFSIPAGRLAYFVDPDGQVIGIQQRGPESEREEDAEALRRWRR